MRPSTLTVIRAFDLLVLDEPTMSRRPRRGSGTRITEVKLAAVRTGHASALAPPGWTPSA